MPHPAAVAKTDGEPWYFTVLVGIGWTVLGLGGLQLLYFLNRYLAFQIGAHGIKWTQMVEVAELGLRWLLASFFGAPLGSTAIACLIFLSVDIARSVRKGRQSD